MAEEEREEKVTEAYCVKCGKDMVYKADGEPRMMAGAAIQLFLDENAPIEFHDYAKRQLGKYMPNDFCEDIQMFFCFECYLDTLLGNRNKFM